MKTKTLKLYILTFATSLLLLPNNIYATDISNSVFNITTSTPVPIAAIKAEDFFKTYHSDTYARDGVYTIQGETETYSVEVKNNINIVESSSITEVIVKNSKGETITTSSSNKPCEMNTNDDGSKNFSYTNEDGFELFAKINENNETLSSTIKENKVNGDVKTITTNEYDNISQKAKSSTISIDNKAKTKEEVIVSNGNKRTSTYSFDSNSDYKLKTIENINQDGSSSLTSYDNLSNSFTHSSTDKDGNKITSVGNFKTTNSVDSSTRKPTTNYDTQIGITIKNDATGVISSVKYDTFKTNDKIESSSENVFSTNDIMQAAKGKTQNQSLADVLNSIQENITNKSATELFNTEGDTTFEVSGTLFDEKAYQYNVLSELLNSANNFDFDNVSDAIDRDMALLYENILKNKDQISSILNEMYKDLNSYLEAFGIDMSSIQGMNLEIPIEENNQSSEPIGTAIGGGNNPNGGGTTSGTTDTSVPTQAPTPTNVLDKDITPDISKETIDKAKEAIDKVTPIPTNTENKTDTTKEEQDNLDKIIKATVDEIANLEELKYNEETFTKNGLIQRNGEMISGLNWRYYIQTDLKIVSEVTDYSIYGLSGVLNSAINESSDGLGSKTLYSYVYDIDGNILKDSVAKSTQSAFCVISQDDVDLAFIRILGKGNQTNYNTAGYVNVILDGSEKETSTTSYKILVSGSRAKNDIETTVTMNAESSKPIPDAFKSICKKLMDTMYETNTTSFGVQKAGTITLSTEQSDYKVIATTGSGKYVYFDEVSDSGYRKTWSYCQDQVLITKDGVKYTINDVLNYDMYSIADLISHGFVCKLNGQVATKEQAKGITIKPSDIKSGLESDSSGKLKDNDSDSVTPTNGIKQKPIAVLDGSNKVDVTKAYSEYIYSSNNYDYFIPEGINENTQILFADEKGTQTKLTVAEALAQKYMNADQFVDAMGEIGVEVIKVGKTTTTPDFQISIKADATADTTITEFFRDDKYIYSLASSSLEDRIVILTADGRKLRLSYVVDNNMYTISQLEQKGLPIYKSLITQNNESVSNNEVEITPTPTLSPTTTISENSISSNTISGN